MILARDARAQEAQDVYGYLPIEVQTMIAEGLGVLPEEALGVSTFYSQFALTPRKVQYFSLPGHRLLRQGRGRSGGQNHQGAGHPAGGMHGGRQVPPDGVPPHRRAAWSRLGPSMTITGA